VKKNVTKQLKLLIVALLLALVSCGAVSAVDSSDVDAQIMDVGVPFVENQGQKDSEVSYYANTFYGTSYITHDGITHQIIGEDNKTLVVKEQFLDSQGNPIIFQAKGEEPSNTVVSYFKGNNPDNWQTNIPTYNFINLGELYPGITVKLRATGSNIEKLFFVNPGAHPDDIQIQMLGIDCLAIDEDGNLVIKSDGFPEVSMSKPIAFQANNNNIEANYQVKDNVYGFAIGDYDHNQQLIIDPTLEYSTYLGGTDDEYGCGVAVDGDGNAYITGETYSTNFPTTLGAFQTSHAGGYEDAFVAKFRTVDRANVIVSKTGNGPLNVGDTGIFTVSLHNNGPNAAHNVAVTDIDVPTGWIVTPSMGSWNPITSTWSVGTLNNGDSATLTISGLVATAMAGTTLTNTVTETQDEQSQETQTATASITVNPLANVIVSKTGNGPLNVGDTGIFTVSLHNDGPNAAHNVAVTDIDVPTGWIVTPSVGSWNPITSTWSVGTLNNGDSATLSISGLITTTMAGTTLTNTVTETQDELNQESQSASASIVVNSVADLYINSWSSKNNPLLGEIFTITFKLGNRGPNTAENVVFTLPLPSGVEFVGVEVDQGTARYDPATRTITWSLGDVVVGDPYAWVRVRALDVGSFIFRPTLTTDTYDPNIESNIQTVTVNVQAAGEPSETVHAQTVGMQKTGAPFIGIVLAILMILGGLITPKKH
jgi:uncharacterized repeat protein (TIGR01451 family)